MESIAETKLYQNFCYEKLKKIDVDNNVKNLSDSWFRQLEDKDCIVRCSRHKARFHKHHCKFTKFIENNEESVEGINLEEMSDCDDRKCLVAKTIKELVITNEYY